MKRSRTLNVVMAALLAVFGLSQLTLEAEAISRYNSTSMSCASVRSAVRSEGAVILRWTSAQGNPRHGRFVASSGYCDHGEIAVAASVPSSDRKSCSVRTCKRCDPFDNDGRFFRLRRC